MEDGRDAAGFSLRRAWGGLVRWRDAHPLLSLYALAAASRLVALAAATAGGLLLAQYPWPLTWTKDAPPWLAHLARWDSGFYLQIAEHGRLDRPELWAFDPGYPLAVRGVRALAPPLGELGAAFVVGALAFAVAVPLLYHLTAAWFDRGTAWRAVALFTLLPGSFYYTAVYADGLFTTLVLGCFLALARRRWLLAGALASFAALTRPNGLLLPALVLMAALLDRARTGRWSLVALAAVPLAAAVPVVDMLVAHAATGDFLYPHHARSATWPQVAWRNPLRSLWWDLGPVHILLVRASFALLVLAAIWAARDAWRRRLDAPLEAHVWTVALGVICFAYSDPAATIRYTLPVLGVTWMLASWARTPSRFALVAALAVVSLATVAALFAAWHPFY